MILAHVKIRRGIWLPFGWLNPFTEDSLIHFPADPLNYDESYRCIHARILFPATGWREKNWGGPCNFGGTGKESNNAIYWPKMWNSQLCASRTFHPSLISQKSAHKTFSKIATNIKNGIWHQELTRSLRKLAETQQAEWRTSIQVSLLDQWVAANVSSQTTQDTVLEWSISRI
jgi:hypothetical protein